MKQCLQIATYNDETLRWEFSEEKITCCKYNEMYHKLVWMDENGDLYLRERIWGKFYFRPF